MKKTVTILNFSPRRNGNCRQVCDAIANAYPNSNIRSYFIACTFTPCGSCNYECLKPGEHCPSLTQSQSEVYDAVLNSDLVYYVVPNFCGMPNAVYYAFNERSVGYFNMDRAVMAKYMAVRKRFILISNTEPSTFMDAMQQQTKDKPEILYLKTSRYGKKSIAGDLMDSEEARADLMAFLAADMS